MKSFKALAAVSVTFLFLAGMAYVAVLTPQFSRQYVSGAK
jgi:hypothetical protein